MTRAWSLHTRHNRHNYLVVGDDAATIFDAIEAVEKVEGTFTVTWGLGVTRTEVGFYENEELIALGDMALAGASNLPDGNQ